MNRKEKNKLKKELKQLNNSVVYDLCEILHKQPSSQKPTMIKRIINSDYSLSEIENIIKQINIALVIEEDITSEQLKKICRSNGISTSGNKHELFKKIIENNLFHVAKLLNKLSQVQINRIYEKIFKRVSRLERMTTIDEILNSFHLPYSKEMEHKPIDKNNKLIFFSYSHKDKEIVGKLKAQLKKNGL